MTGRRRVGRQRRWAADATIPITCGSPKRGSWRRPPRRRAAHPAVCHPRSGRGGFEKMLGSRHEDGLDRRRRFHIKAHTEWPVCGGTNLWELIEARAAATPDLEMAVDERGDRLTFGAVRAEAETVAAGIARSASARAMSCRGTCRVGIDAVVLSAAINRLDVVQNPIIAIYREREVAFCTRQTGAKLLIVPGVWRGLRLHAPWPMRSPRRTIALEVLTVAPRGALPKGDPATLAADPPPPASSRDGRCAGSCTPRAPRAIRRAHGTPITRIAIVARAIGAAARRTPW